MDQNIEVLDDLLTGWAQNINGRSELINFRMVADNPQYTPSRICVGMTIDELLWQPGDPVQLQ
jgi:hypothetical protein